jgi:hypothetical protein
MIPRLSGPANTEPWRPRLEPSSIPRLDRGRQPLRHRRDSRDVHARNPFFHHARSQCHQSDCPGLRDAKPRGARLRVAKHRQRDALKCVVAPSDRRQVGHADGILSKRSTCQLSAFVLPSHKTVTICCTGNGLMMMPSMRRLWSRRRFSPCAVASWLNFTLAPLFKDRYELPGRCLKSLSGRAGLRIILDGITHSSAVWRERGRVSQPLTPRVKSVMTHTSTIVCSIANAGELLRYRTNQLNISTCGKFVARPAAAVQLIGGLRARLRLKLSLIVYRISYPDYFNCT